MGVNLHRNSLDRLGARSEIQIPEIILHQVPNLDDGQPLPPGNARFPTQLGPQMRGGNKAYKSRSRKHRGGGIISDFNSLVANVGYKFNDFNSELDGVNPPPNPNPYDQPIQRM
jgi:hypothetical protein